MTARANPHRHRGRNPPCRPRARRIRRGPVQSDRPARRHRAVARRQDGVHHRAGAQSAAWRPPAGVRGAGRRAHRARAARAAARRRGAALRLRGASARADRRAALAGVDHAASASCASSSTTSRRARRAQSHAHPRHRRLSGRMAARPAAARRRATREWSAETLAAVAQRPRARRSPAPGTRISRRSIRPRPRTSRRRARPRGCSPTICAPAATSATRCACCRPAAS